MTHLVVAYHGILTGLTNPNWTLRFQAWLLNRAVQCPLVVTDHYTALPLPWLNWFGNRRHGKALARRLELLAKHSPDWVQIDFICHSNGACIVLDAIHRLHERGIKVNTAIFIAGAIDNCPEATGLAPIHRRGGLNRAIAWWSSTDAALGMPTPLRWPYGNLGRTGWRWLGKHWRDDYPQFISIEHPGYGHGGYFDEGRIDSTFERLADQLAIPLRTAGTPAISRSSLPVHGVN